MSSTTTVICDFCQVDMSKQPKKIVELKIAGTTVNRRLDICETCCTKHGVKDYAVNMKPEDAESLIRRGMEMIAQDVIDNQ